MEEQWQLLKEHLAEIVEMGGEGSNYIAEILTYMYELET